jgi:glutamate-1-semialdehyde 2,1-aminomutase
MFGIKPDMTTLGKIIGGGLPVGAYGGKKEIMDFVSPVGPVYQAGTLSGNPLAMAAGIAMLKFLKQNPSVYKQINEATVQLVDGLQEINTKAGLNLTINQVGSMFTMFFTDQKVIDFNTAKTADTSRFGKYFQQMLHSGIYIAPSQFEAMFISLSVTGDVIETILKAHGDSIEGI